MSEFITTAFIQEYKMNVEHLLQQKGSRLRNAVITESCHGKLARVKNQIGKVSAQRRTTRHADTPIISTPHAARWVAPEDWDWGDMIDDQDIVRSLNDFESPYAMAGAMAIGRSMDEVIIEAALGSALTGENGTTSTAFDTTNQRIASGSVGLTVDKLIQTKKKFVANEVDPMEELYLVHTAEQLEDLLQSTEVGSYDYNSVRGLQKGEVTGFMGFNFINCELLGVNSSSERRCFAWAKSGICLGMWEDTQVEIEKRADKGFNTQVYVKATFGATRVEEGKVVEVLCTE